jgi:hypothetical protein
MCYRLFLPTKNGPNNVIGYLFRVAHETQLDLYLGFSLQRLLFAVHVVSALLKRLKSRM